MAGLISTQMQSEEEEDILAPGKTLKAVGVGYEPEIRQVTTPETVLGQLDTVLAKDSPLVTRARANAAQAANARGLLNTSMAVRAGEAAAIDAALPIAVQDAQTHNLAARENQAARNTGLQFGAEAANRAGALNAARAAALANIRETGATERSLQALKGEQAIALANIERSLQTLKGEQALANIRETGATERSLQALRGEQALANIRETGATERALQALKGAQATSLAGIEARYKQLIQANDSAATFFDSVVKSIGAVLSNVDTSKDQKDAAVAKLTQMMESGLAVIGSIANINLTSLLTFR